MTEILENLTIRPGDAGRGDRSTDLLSHVLAQIRLTGERVYSAALTKRGRLELEPGAGYVCVVTKGALHAEQDGGTPIVVETGDLILLPRGAGELRFKAPPGSKALCIFSWSRPATSSQAPP
jgi:hypothetical protein